MFHFRFVLPVLLALLLPGLSLAKDQKRLIVDPANRPQFAEQVAAIRDAMKPGGRFQYLTGEERDSVNEHLDAITAMLKRREAERFGSDTDPPQRRPPDLRKTRADWVEFQDQEMRDLHRAHANPRRHAANLLRSDTPDAGRLLQHSREVLKPQRRSTRCEIA